MKTARPAYDVVSLFDSSWQANKLNYEQSNRGLAARLLTATLVIVVVGLLLGTFQYFSDTTSTPIIAGEAEDDQIDSVSSETTNPVSTYTDAGPGYVGR